MQMIFIFISLTFSVNQQIKYNFKYSYFMSDYFYTSSYKNTYSEQPTYLGSGTDTQANIDYTPDRYQTFSAKKGSRLSSARRSLEECIQMVSQKKQMNQQALDQVKQVNHQVLGSLSWFNPAKANQYSPRNKTTDQHRRDTSRDDVVISQFQWNPYTPPRLHQSQYRPSTSFNYDNNQQNSELRSRLNNEIKKNNELLKHINHLQSQASTLKASNYNLQQNGNIQEILQENRSLRNQLANSQLGGNYNLIEELQRLKAENSELRRDTINMLRSRQY